MYCFDYIWSGDAVSIISKDEVCCNGLASNETVLCCEGITTCPKRRPDDNECCYNFKTKEAQTYNSIKNEHCVQGEVIELPEGAEACGLLNFYFPESQFCCGEKVYNFATGFDSCCDDKPYKSLTQQCCNYEISNISPEEGRYVNTSSHLIHLLFLFKYARMEIVAAIAMLQWLLKKTIHWSCHSMWRSGWVTEDTS